METAPPALDAQTALVTGGARRVGAEIVRHLHAAGANVAIHCNRSAAAAQALAAELESRRSGSAAVFGADLRQPEAAPRLIADVVGRFGGLQLLVNNAASFYPTPWPKVTPAQWADLMGTNVQAPLFLAQAASAELRRARGLIVNIVDIHGMRSLPGYLVYSTSKAGLIHLTQALARELAPIRRTLLQRPGSPADIAAAVIYFATAAPFVTGQILAVDGGRSLRR